MRGYVNTESQLKQTVRNLVIKHLFDSLIIDQVNVTILSLPASNFIFEQNIAKLYPDVQFKFICLEHDKKIYEEAQETLKSISIPNLSITHVQSSINQWLLKNDITFDYAWLDYCGYYNNNIVADLKLLKSNALSVTVMGSRERYLPEELIRDVQDFTVLREHDIPENIKVITGKEINSVVKYRDAAHNSYHTNMYTYCLGINNVETVRYELSSKKHEVQTTTTKSRKRYRGTAIST